MSELSKKEFLAEVREIEPFYRPNSKALKAISRVSLVTIAGPSGAGKDTIRRRLYGVPQVVCDTIRPPEIRNGRLEESGVDYVFRHNRLHKVLEDLHDGKYVQFGMGPSKKSFYGSRPKQYPESGPAVIDVMANQLPTLRKHFVAGVCSIYVVPLPNRWMDRLEGRGKLSDEELELRKIEAGRSLSMALDDEDTFFVVNEDMRRAADETRRVIDAISIGADFADNPGIDISRHLLARATAEELLAQLQETV